MATGTVKWFNDSKGYRFITPDEGGDDLFAHFSGINMQGFKTPNEDQKVSFEVTTGPNDKQASNIQGAQSQRGAKSRRDGTGNPLRRIFCCRCETRQLECR